MIKCKKGMAHWVGKATQLVLQKYGYISKCIPNFEKEFNCKVTDCNEYHLIEFDTPGDEIVFRLRFQ